MQASKALQNITMVCKNELYNVHAVKLVGSLFSSPLGLQLTLRLLTSTTDHLSAHLVAVSPRHSHCS
jgi:hypothetical protein